MSRKPPMLAYWLLLLVPTLAAGLLVFRLLGRERERVSLAARAATAERVRLLAENLVLAVRDTQEGLTQALLGMDRARLPEALSAWERANPLVRNVFVWDKRVGLQWPAADSQTGEEQLFARRYEELFEGRTSFTASESQEEGPPASSLPPQETVEGGVQELTAPPPAPASSVQLQQKVSARSQLRQMAEQVTVPGQVSMPQAQAPGPQSAPAAHGWIPWFAGRQLYWLGWVRDAGSDRVFGVELEMTVLLSRLTAEVPEDREADSAFALVDGEGRVFHKTGGLDLEKPPRPAAAVELSPALPHWQAAFYTRAAPGAAAGRGFMLAAGLLTALLMLSVLAGGALLLFEARRSARDALQKTTFVANVSHELKTPLTTIRMYAELLGEGRVTAEEKRRKYLDVIVKESGRLTRLVNNVLDFGRLEQHRKKYRPEPIELAGWLEALLEPQRMRIEEAGMRLELRPPPEPLTVSADRDALEQVVLNLLDNAVKYAANGKGIEVEASARPEGGATIRMLDRGPGIPPALRERIFEKFYRADDSLTARTPGSGLGLSIARRLMRDLGGDVVCEPREGGGACFRIRLAASEQG